MNFTNIGPRGSKHKPASLRPGRIFDPPLPEPLPYLETSLREATHDTTVLSPELRFPSSAGPPCGGHQAVMPSLAFNQLSVLLSLLSSVRLVIAILLSAGVDC